MIKDKSKIVSFYENSGEIRYKATLLGDYKKGNRETPKLIRVFKMFEEDKDFAWECISELLKSNNVVVRTDGAAYCLALGIQTQTAVNVLEEISSNPENGIFGFNAKMTLKVWREDGTLSMYSK